MYPNSVMFPNEAGGMMCTVSRLGMWTSGDVSRLILHSFVLGSEDGSIPTLWLLVYLR